MKDCNRSKTRTRRRILPIASATALALAFTLSPSQPAHATDVTPPAVPEKLHVPPGNEAFLEGHGVGTQNYICVPSASSASGVAFALFTPQATLFNDAGEEITTHFFSPNPFEDAGNPAVVADGPIRATWQHARDSSTVWAKVDQPSTDPAFVKPGAVAWLLLEAVGAQDGPTGGDRLTATTFIQRVNTAGGLAPSAGCISPADIGNEAFVPYTADYFFYRSSYGD